ncbi:MAG: hydrogenase maturation protease [Desulfocapsaceae bacterium]|nr:hydrogenase maturation protease [Desulfocapsaceae bacterium]
MNTRIICVGNRLFAPDSAGPMVYDILSSGQLPKRVELIDGGLAGLNLLCCLEGIDLVIFVDSVQGFRDAPGIIIMNVFDSLHICQDYDHNAGLGYLLQAAPQVLEEKLPEIVLVGIQTDSDSRLYHRAARMCLEIVSGYRRQTVS